jgi:hypothetical protein
MIWVRTPVRRHLSAALPVGLPRRADDEDLPDETVYPGHALTDPTAGQRSDRFYFINFPAGDGLSAGVECAAVLGNGRRANPGGIIFGVTVREAAKSGWALMRACNPRCCSILFRRVRLSGGDGLRSDLRLYHGRRG